MAEDPTTPAPEETPASTPVAETPSAPESIETAPVADAPASAETTAPASAEPAATASAEPAATAVAEPAAPKAPKVKAAKSKKTEAAAEEKKPENLSLTDDIEKVKIVKAKGSKNIATGVAYVLSTFNNTTVTITDLAGNVIAWSSAGKMNFRGSRKSTAYAAQVVAQDACRQAMGHGLKEVEVRVKGPGAGRESAVRAIQAVGLEISVIRDITPVPHNGCRPPKQRRV